MRSSWKTLVAAAVGLLVLPQMAAADEVQEQLQQMQERMNQLEEKLTATTDQLEDSQRKVEHQEKMIERAGLEDERAASSGIASFFESVEFEGWVQGSYWYNINDFANGGTGGANVGTFGLANPFNPDSNTFQLDQLWFSMAKPATEESRGGFAADIVMGKTADTLLGTSNVGFPNGNNVTVYQAYAEYLAPIGPGLNIRAGRFGSHIGAEVPQATANYNISRGLVYSILQPFNHVGVFTSMETEAGFTFGAGVVNDSYANANTNPDDEMAYQWKLGFNQESWSIAYNGQWGTTGGPGSADFLISDGLLTWDPSENLSTWANVTGVTTFNNGAGNPYAIGVALAGRLAITEATGFSIRGEYIFSNRDYLGFTAATGPVAGGVGDQDLWSITGTLDHALTEALMVRGEVRYEQGNQSGGGIGDNIFYLEQKSGALAATDQQVLVGADIIYRF